MKGEVRYSLYRWEARSWRTSVTAVLAGSWEELGSGWSSVSRQAGSARASQHGTCWSPGP